jgi:hypothetical protein
MLQGFTGFKGELNRLWGIIETNPAMKENFKVGRGHIEEEGERGAHDPAQSVGDRRLLPLRDRVNAVEMETKRISKEIRNETKFKKILLDKSQRKNEKNFTELSQSSGQEAESNQYSADATELSILSLYIQLNRVRLESSDILYEIIRHRLAINGLFHDKENVRHGNSDKIDSADNDEFSKAREENAEQALASLHNRLHDVSIEMNEMRNKIWSLVDSNKAQKGSIVGDRGESSKEASYEG